tara:strand:- start:3303 stop:5318 length:2016 start_codon:yes stop_codon:yes gene_type:complete
MNDYNDLLFCKEKYKDKMLLKKKLWNHWNKYGKEEKRVIKSIKNNITKNDNVKRIISTNSTILSTNNTKLHNIVHDKPFHDYIYYSHQMDNLLNKINFKQDKSMKNILVFDMMFIKGGAYVYLQNLILKYKDKWNFLIIRETMKDNLLTVSLNDEAFILTNINSTKLQEFIKNINYEYVLINSLVNQSNEHINFIKNLNGYKIGITHDFSILYEEVQPIDCENLTKKLDESFYDLLLTQHKINEKNMKLNNNVTVELPDYFEKKNIHYTSNNKIKVGIIGAISVIKGMNFYKDLANYINENNLHDKFELKIFGITSIHVNIQRESYKDIDMLNNQLIDFKPNIILEASIWPETWSYTLTLSKIISCPILYLKKNFNSVVPSRLQDIESYEFNTVDECVNLMEKYSQNYFYTIKNELKYPYFYDSLFSSKYIENLIVITSKIVVSDKNYTYTPNRSIYSSYERYNQTLDTINSIKKNFKNKNYKILLIDNSVMNKDMIENIKKNVDIFLERKDIKNIDFYTDDSIVKGIGEAAQQLEVNNYIKNEMISFKHLFKISGRYLINENFDYNEMNISKNVFKLAREVISHHPGVSGYYYTSLYKIHFNYFNEFNKCMEVILDDENLLLLSYGYEQILPKLIIEYAGLESLYQISSLGITQNISVWKRDRYRYQEHV